jgi:hypothetical protein
MGRPDDAEMKQVLSIIDTPENQPVFVHCKQGLHPWERGMKNHIRDYYQRRLKQKILSLNNICRLYFGGLSLSRRSVGMNLAPDSQGWRVQRNVEHKPDPTPRGMLARDPE